ncbi:hypothetical protein BUALT_Bualt08G0009400 [Buddleja alternifolia]|uniref:Uncharacterized protein n=1 Tax=Buddleja alternifolia TaxID=168488 RepID=A0AAV6XA51_9LAMI|nr:hypothetical protein BUALT_Bualt08G0009400 [Buddleja alternifolia]
MSCSSFQRKLKHAEQSLELRYGSNPPCDCFKKSQSRVVESEMKPSKVWSPSGILIKFTLDKFVSKNDEEFEDVVSVVSGGF